MTVTPQNIGLGSLIVQTLRQYKSVTVEFLAYRFNRETKEINRYVDALEKAGAITRNGEMLSLVEVQHQQSE
jgi:DeoR/GlpR family transcriptional regulator of sugar metabolism